MISGQTNAHRPNLACCLFCKYKFSHWFTYCLWLYLFIANGGSYNTAMPIYFHIGYGCFCTIGLELTSCDKDCMACKAENICYLVLSEKSFWPLNEMTNQLKWDRLVSGSRGESERYSREKDTEFKIKRTSSRSVFSPGAGQLVCVRELAIVSPSPQHDDRSGLLRSPCWRRNQIHPGSHGASMLASITEAWCNWQKPVNMQGDVIPFFVVQGALGNPAGPGCVQRHGQLLPHRANSSWHWATWTTKQRFYY